MTSRLTARLCGVALVVALSATSAAAVSVTIETTRYAASDLAAARAAHAAHLAGAADYVVEDFESFPAWGGEAGTPNLASGGAGDLIGAGAEPGSGRTAVDGGTGVEVRSDTHPSVPGSYTALSGRFNTSLGGANWLDSNDLEEIVWNVNGGGALGPFDSLVFFLTDVGDIKGTDFRIEVTGAGIDPAVHHIARQANGTLNLVRILFEETVTAATLRLVSAHNDGFGIDDVGVARMAAAPLPPAALMLLAGIGGLAAVRRRRGGA